MNELIKKAVEDEWRHGQCPQAYHWASHNSKDIFSSDWYVEKGFRIDVESFAIQACERLLAQLREQIEKDLDLQLNRMLSQAGREGREPYTWELMGAGAIRESKKILLALLSAEVKSQ